ncbi:hypothetical protein BDD18_2394 [Acidovorax temperans]|uniref:Uncharacterized protein n=1 Tax=Acidovorax temperans TaxID=80878 RepID=A0A543L8K4_9BURK|nr:hypothetical protein BDD18_2394 [Acidovorax temperans]
MPFRVGASIPLVHVALLGVASTQSQSAQVVVSSQVESVLAAGTCRSFVQRHSCVDSQTTEGRSAIANLIDITHHASVQGVNRRASVVVVHADVVSSGVVGLSNEIAQTDSTEAAGQVHFALATEESAGRGTGVRFKTTFQLEASLQAATQVFRALEAETRGVVEQASRLDVAHFLAFHGGVHATIQGHAALSESSGAAQASQHSQCQTIRLLHEGSLFAFSPSGGVALQLHWGRQQKLSLQLHKF